MKNSYPVAFACLVTGPGNCQCLSPRRRAKKAGSWISFALRSAFRHLGARNMYTNKQKRHFATSKTHHHLDGQERTWERGCIINNIISSSSSSSFLFALLHYSKKVYSYISFGPIFEVKDKTIGIIGITGHVHLYLFSVKKIIFYNFILEISSSRIA